MDNKTSQALDIVLDEAYDTAINHAVEVVLLNNIPANPVVTRVLNKIITELNQLKNERLS